MPNINSINISYSNNLPYITTKRTCIDNSEIYIASKLYTLYQNTISNRKLFLSKHSLKKMVENYIN